MKVCWCTNAERTDDVIIYEDHENENGLFGLAAILLEEFDTEEKFEQHAQLLIEMLHCYILPIINFKTRDIPPIVTALAGQDVCLECLDANIMAQTNCVEGCRTTLTAYLKNDVGPRMSSMFGRNQCPRDFLELIIKDINKQEVEIREKSDKYQYYVDEAKAALACADSAANKEKLKKARSQRDLYFSNLQALLLLRETAIDALKNSLEENNAYGSIENLMMKNYMTIREEFCSAKLGLFNMCKFKVCALTIRESLYNLREELTNQGFSQGTGYFCESCSDTDGGVQSKSDYQTTAEKLAMVFQTNRHLRVKALEFVKRTEKHCKEVMKVLVDGGNREEQRLIAWETVSSVVKKLLKKMKDGVQSHLHEAAPELAGAMQIHYRSKGDAEMQIQSIQLGYEEHVFSKLGKCIELIYEMINEETAEEIVEHAESAKRLNRDDLIRDLELENEWWMDWFSQGEVPEPVDSGTDIVGFFTRQRSYSCPKSSDFPVESDLDSGDEFNIKALLSPSPQTNSQQVFIHFGEHSSFTPSYTPVLSSNTISQVKVGKNPRSLSMEIPMTYRRPRAVSCPGGMSPEGPPGITDSVAAILSHLEPPLEEVDNGHIKCISTKDWLVIERDEDASDVTKTSTSNRTASYSSEKKPEFLEHFGRVLDYIRDTFHEPAPINKLKCLRAALVECTSSVEELRYQKCKDYLKNAVAAHELIPFIILILRELESSEIALLYSQIAFLEDYMASFLTAGVYSWSLTMITASHKELVGIGKRSVLN